MDPPPSTVEEDADSVSSAASSALGEDDELEQQQQVLETQKQEVRDVKNLAKSETRRLRIAKLVLFASILATAAAVTSLAYKFLEQDEDDVRQMHYGELAKGICDAAEFHAQNLFTSMASAALTVSGAALASNATFPYVTVPAFEVLGQTTRAQSGIEFLLFTPLITDLTMDEWGRYSEKHQGWLEESRNLALAASAQEGSEATVFSSDFNLDPIYPQLFEYDLEDPTVRIPPTTKSPYFPIWQMSPTPFNPSQIVNFNRASKPFFESHLSSVMNSNHGTLSPVFNPKVLANWAIKDADHDAYHAQFATNLDGITVTAFERPHCGFMQPVYKDMYDKRSEIVATMQAGVPWDRYLVNLLPEGVNGIQVVLSNTCDQSYTYELDGNDAYYVGSGDLHDRRYDDMVVSAPFGVYDELTKSVGGHCMYSLNIYPTDTFMEVYESATAALVAFAMALAFFVMILAFGVYGRYVKSRNRTIVAAAARSNVLLASLFPKNVRDQLVAEKVQEEQKTGAKNQLKSFLNNNNIPTELETTDNSNSNNSLDILDPTSSGSTSKPIADLFPETTILFCDIAGFTAWSSTREPSQVFTLLETLYNAFDAIAVKRGIYKVETIGDCYVAVTGLPDPRPDHAVAMVRFARDIMTKVRNLRHQLEVTLGPGTGELDLRTGIHSGPVTAGVLRGQRSRFQLFGDTMNVASRMESCGIKGKIQCSTDTAALLIDSGKGKWLTPREETIQAKGKGELQTYWVSLSSGRATSSGGTSNTTATRMSSSTGGTVTNLHFIEPMPSSDQGSTLDDCSVATSPSLAALEKRPKKKRKLDAKTKRLVKWNVETMANLLLKIKAGRARTSGGIFKSSSGRRLNKKASQRSFRNLNRIVSEEVEEVIELPTLDTSRRSNKGRLEEDAVEPLDPLVLQQLEAFVTRIARMYSSTNPFHNFEHASHVTSSVVKLLGRIIAPDLDIDSSDRVDFETALHDNTYGITSDPLTQFACVFSALIHDVDHSGVPNAQLMIENPQLAEFYKNKSVAEQNSVDVAWYLLFEGKYPELRAAIYQTSEEKSRFRKLVVNSVMATDILDPDLKKLRNGRWDKAFSDAASVDGSKRAVDRKATIVIEHLIQASDVSHTMQHWDVYRKWNECLFKEMFQAYKAGRSQRDPSIDWYKNEIGFFDFYIIPLAKKLKECGVFGVSSDEYLNYAVKNREEWKAKGKDVVAAMLANANKSKPKKKKSTSSTSSS